MKQRKEVIQKVTSPYLSPYKVRKVRLLEGSERTRKLLEGIHTKEQLSMLVTALGMIVGSESLQYFKALLYGLNHTPHYESAKIFESAEQIVEAMIPDELLEELQQLINISKAEEHGFIYDEKKNSYSFNANVFAKHFISRCHIRSTKDGRLFLYHSKGVYEEPTEVELGKVIRTLMHEGRWSSWNSKSEAEVVKALLRESDTVDEMNTMRNFINLKNGMLSLDRFELLPHHPSYLSTVQLPIDYDPEAVAPTFMQFIREITIDDEELIRVHQEILGYLLSAETKAEKAFFFYGSGANGKSVLTAIITQLVGKENMSSIPLTEFGQQFGLEGLINKTVNIAAENELGGKALKTENFKAIVSGDTITINIKYHPAISYKPHCKLVFVVNALPDSMDVTNGFFRKLIIVPFNRTFKPNERNVNLLQELLKELPGILNWAIKGLKRLRENNYQFSQCRVIEECHRTYYAEQNPVREFFLEHVVLKEGTRTKRSDFYDKYLRWLNMQGIDDKRTKSRQIFWKYFKVVLENECIPIVEKKVKGTVSFDGMEIVGLDNLQVPTMDTEFIQF
ncbi:phage/plasmid primase, P4 family [Bacillus sp. AFS040349]|uniref:DNA primase family protein n=1 Tax=Bacillus sp. AFS040349 TaxID=2033502 RepID=UPI000BFB62F7|nr:phage/plasmid primase, P4 family [Bacillus sp. AFS040349]PGT88753.1 DNA primase [Bacillus sp. AFS040349]